MTWAKLDDNTWTDPTLCALSGDAFRLHVFALTYCCQKLTDGELTRDAVARIGFMFGLRDQALEKAITELVTFDVWSAELDGYAITEFTETNPTREKVEAARLANRERQADWIKRQADKRAQKRSRRST
ncbi:MAG: hypothetical protein E6J28_11750 [Chloroflexi bacterium]|nr:MAG: hypothetical protein E6J28_11750 [Chloroflexota bacterium]